MVSGEVVLSVDGMVNDLYHCSVDSYNLDLDSCKHHLLVVECPFHILHCDMIPTGVSKARWAKWVSMADLFVE